METKQQKLSEFNKNFKEIETLKKMGLREEEIAYLVWLKAKNNMKAHWR